MNRYERVVVLSIDALRASHLPVHGYDRDTAPYISSLAERGQWFRSCYSMSSHTRESMPAVLTGQFPDTVLGRQYRLTTPTVAGDLSVRSAMFHSNPFLSRAYGFDEGFDAFDDDLWMGRNRLLTLARRAVDKLRNRHYVRAEEINDRSLAWIDDESEDRFLLWNHYMDVHGPYQPPMPYREEFGRGEVSDRDSQLLLQKGIRRPQGITAHERQTLIDLYDAEIRYLDDQIREFVAALRTRSLLDGTLFILTADHGEALGEDGIYEHPRTLTEGLTHVPLILWATDIDPVTVETATGSLDIAPTVLRALDAPAIEQGASGETTWKRPFSGTGLQTVAGDGTRNDAERVVISQVTRKDNTERQFRARTSDEVASATLDMSSGETAVDGDERPADVLRRHLAEGRDGGRDMTEPTAVDDEVERRLRGLGYLDDE